MNKLLLSIFGIAILLTGIFSGISISDVQADKQDKIKSMKYVHLQSDGICTWDLPNIQLPIGYCPNDPIRNDQTYTNYFTGSYWIDDSDVTENSVVVVSQIGNSCHLGYISSNTLFPTHPNGFALYDCGQGFDYPLSYVVMNP